MKLLIITQKVDHDDPVLGFFHRWIEEFAGRYSRVTVICLQRGVFNLPPNVKVLSLGKEQRHSRLHYVVKFYNHIWREKKKYDVVFVHMNQEYVLLGGVLWRWWGKRVFLWRNHPLGNWLTGLAVGLSHVVFCTSPHSFTARFEKTRLVPVGIDTDFFRPNTSVQKKPHSILFLGRIAPVKNVVLFVETLNELQKLVADFFVTVAGVALPKDAVYEKVVREKVLNYGLNNKVRFVGPVTQDQALRLYHEHELYVNLTPTGSMDKTIFEAMACGVTPLIFNRDIKAVLGDELVIPELKPINIARRISRVLWGGRGDDFRNFVAENHSLELLMDKLCYFFRRQQ